jgi:hypothetical protein
VRPDGPRRAKIDAMLGPILLAIAIVLVLPPLFLVGGLVFSAIVGWLLVDHAETTHEGSELIELNT